MNPSERGSGTMLAVAAALLGCMVATGVILGGIVIAGQQQVRQAADLVALSAATARAGDESACTEAERVAPENGVSLVACEVAGDDLDLAVTVTVSRTLGLPGGLRYALTATAHAGWLSGLP